VRQLAIACVVAAMAGGCAETWKPVTVPDGEVVFADLSVFGSPWVWLDDRGERVSLAKWRGTPLVVAAVYTTCVETCPRTIVKLRRVYDDFVRDGRRAEFVVVTLDPSIDTPERLRQFRKDRHMPEAWHLLTGSRQDTAQLMAMLDVDVMDMDTHLVHDSKITLFDADGRRTAWLGVR
jgi:protein SCO1/2